MSPDSEQSPWLAPTDSALLAILGRARPVAVVGASDNPDRASFSVASYLLTSTDYTVWLVNPRVDSIMGHRTFPDLRSLPEPPDIVDVFRKVSDLPEVLDEAIEVGATTLWLQLGLSDEGIARRAEAAGLSVVMDRCMYMEHERLFGD